MNIWNVYDNNDSNAKQWQVMDKFWSEKLTWEPSAQVSQKQQKNKNSLTKTFARNDICYWNILFFIVFCFCIILKIEDIESLLKYTSIIYFVWNYENIIYMY